MREIVAGAPAEQLAAGNFSSWLGEIQGAIRGDRGSDVPCQGCTACCTSSQFVHVEPDERDTLAHLPPELLFPAPGLPEGHVLLGYDERGHCPMLVDNRCSIYPHRPRTCRTYDCRVFPASGIELDDERKALIAERARRWRFRFPTPVDQVEHGAVRAAASFLQDHPELVPAAVPASATQIAVLAIGIHDLFLRRDPTTGEARVFQPDPEAVRTELLGRTARDVEPGRNRL